MGRNQYPLNDRIKACEAELAQLCNDYEYLNRAVIAALPDANFGSTGQLIALVVSRKDQRSTLFQLRNAISNIRVFQRRIAAFRRLLGTLEDDCSGASFWQATKVAEMVVDAAGLEVLSDMEDLQKAERSLTRDISEINSMVG